jgi:hypothetical protein
MTLEIESPAAVMLAMNKVYEGYVWRFPFFIIHRILVLFTPATLEVTGLSGMSLSLTCNMYDFEVLLFVTGTSEGKKPISRQQPSVQHTQPLQ